MNKKATFLKIAGMFVLAVMLVSCNGLKKMAKNYDSVSYQVTPEVLEAQGDVVSFSVKGTVPAKFFNRKAAIFFQPVVKYDGGEIMLTPFLLKGEKVEGEGTTVSYDNGGTFTYSDEFAFTPDMKVSELMVTSIAFLPKTAVAAGLTMADAQKLPKAVNMGDVKLADGVIYTSQRIEVANEVSETIEVGEEVIEMDASGNVNVAAYQVEGQYQVDLLKLAPHGYEKVTIVTEETDVYYPKNLYHFNKNLKCNKKKDVMAGLAKINDFVRQGWVIKDIEVNGWASPEGEETFNDGLSENRAKNSVNILNRNLKKLVKEKDAKVGFTNPKEDINFKITGNGPDWNGFLKAVENSSIKDKRTILNVVKSTDPLKREEEIRNMITIYPELEEMVLPPLRRASIAVNCYEPKKTDDEIARLATSNPKALNVAELLYAATLTQDWNTQYNIYKATFQNFPKCYRAYNNAGYVALKLGKLDEAIQHLNKADQLKPNDGMIINNLGVAYAYKNNYKQAEKYFLNANKMGVDNNYNLGLIDITKGDYKSALNKFSGVKCNYNVALAQLLSGNTSGAAANLECARKNAATYYLMAVVGARTANETMMLMNLKKSIKADAAYKAEAATDREFIKYFETPAFQEIVK